MEAIGSCTGIKEKPSGWTEVEVSIAGKQYPLRLSTKKEELILATRSLGGDVGVFTYSERESDTINPHTSQPYINRYLDAVAPYGDNGSGAPHHAPVVGGDKDRAITRMACLKAAAEIYAGKALTEFEDGTADDVPLAVMKAAHRFERDVYRDIDAPPFE